MRKLIRVLPVIIPMLILVGCSGGSSSSRVPPPPPPPPPPPVVTSAAGIWAGQAVTPDIPDIVTSFEFDDADGFVVGNAPFTADFQGGIAESRGIGALYTDGLFSWHLTGAGSISFATAGTTLSFDTRTVTAGDNATIQVFDENGVEISSTVVPNAFTNVNVVRDPNAGDSLIESVVITVASGEIVIDSFTFGFPSTASIDDIACLIAPTDEFVCIVSDPVTDAFVAGANGTVLVTNGQVSGSGNLYAAPGETLADGSTVAALTISAGAVVADTSLDVTIDSTGLSIDVSSAFDDIYDRPADLATVAAVYAMFDVFGDMSSFEIDAAGVISGQTATGCVLSGQVSVVDASVNAYDVNLVADAATCGALGGDYSGLGVSADESAMDDSFVFAVFVNGQSMIVGAAIK